MHKVIFCLTGNTFSGRFLDCFIETIVYCSKANISFSIIRQESSVVYFVRNKCLCGDTLRGENQKPFDGKIDYSHLMWIDNDIIFTPQQFQKLLDHDKDIVSGFYMMESRTQVATVEKWDEEKFKLDGSFEFLKLEDLKNKDGLFEVAYTGLGFMLVKKGVFESLSYPWFRPLFFDIGTAKDFCSEDVSFCRLAIEKGFKIFVDPQLRVGHEKKVVL
jgi:hypothetical protein